MKKTPGQVESALAVARAAIDAREFGRARAVLAPYLSAPTKRVALLMAELERADHNDEGRAREWVARALHAAPDPQWTADGHVSDRWLPISPVSGRLDAFEWRVPLTGMISAPVIEPEPQPETSEETELEHVRCSAVAIRGRARAACARRAATAGAAAGRRVPSAPVGRDGVRRRCSP